MTIKQIHLILAILILLVTFANAGTDSNGVIRLSGNADTVSTAQPSNRPNPRQAKWIRYVGTNTSKSITIRERNATGDILWSGYLIHDEHNDDFAAGTTHTMTWPVQFDLPNTGMYLNTDDTSTSGAVYVYTANRNGL